MSSERGPIVPVSISGGFFIKRGFATQEEAAQAGLTFAKEWIDDGRSTLSKSVVREF